VRQNLVERNHPIEQVYFFDNGVGSIVSDDEGGDAVEVGLFGRRHVGNGRAARKRRTPLTTFIQVGDPSANMIGTDDLLAACRASASCTRRCFAMSRPGRAGGDDGRANAHYALPERLARWLLMCHDRADGERIELTHEFMSIMLAVRRSGVTVTLHTLEGTGAIRNDRGVVTILDRARLEEIAGPSYGAPEAEYRRLFGPTPALPTRASDRTTESA
jgi:hypothetical protein